MENLELILDIPLQIDIQLGQTKMPLNEVLELASGSIIKLNKSESDPVELLINGKLVAEGKIVVTEGNILGIQVSSVVNRVERIRSLK
jgi:flagellar motor switch protein FliN/FliY